jgi:hypothetical protein
LVNGWILVLTSGIYTKDLPEKELFLKNKNQVLIPSNREGRFLPKVDDDLISYIKYNAAI